MDISKLQQEIEKMEKSLARMKEQLKEAEQKNDKDFYPENKDSEFLPEYALKAVDGYCVYLACAFYWDLTPQGYDYWEQKWCGVAPITDEDKITILRWCVNYYKAQTK